MGGRHWQASLRTEGAEDGQCNCESYLKTDFDVQKTKSHSNQSTVIKRAGMLKACAPRTADGNAGGPGRASPGGHRAAWLPVPSPLGPSAQPVVTDTDEACAGAYRSGKDRGWCAQMEEKHPGGRIGCAGPSGLTREGKALLPHKGVVWPLAGPVEQAGAAGASMRALGSREHSRLGPSAHRTQGGQSGKRQGQHPGFWRVGPWVVTTCAPQCVKSREKCRWARRQGWREQGRSDHKTPAPAGVRVGRLTEKWPFM